MGFKWTALPKLPTKSGRYILAHRGTAKIMYYLSPKDAVGRRATTGWQGDISFAPTHWAKLPSILATANIKFNRFEFAENNNHYGEKNEQN